LFGHSVGSWNDQLIGNALFIVPWVFIALCLFGAEDYGRLSLEKTRNELQYLRHQINPHFLLNTHNNIHFLIEQDPQLAAATLLQLSGIMQYMLYECSADTVPVSKELNNLVNYIQLEKIRQEPTLTVQHNLAGVTSDIHIAPLLLLSFIENAFKHVSHYKDRQNFITIEAKVENNELHFSVQNSKTGAPTRNKLSGIGLVNVQQRLKLLYPKRHHLVIENEAEHFAIFLTIQLQ
jgi:two-component system, LytTR family, sensor kinase